MRTTSLTIYARRHGLPKQYALKLFREGRLPSFVGAVVNGPISVKEWARRNGVSRPVASRLFHGGHLTGVVRGNRPRPRDPWWATPKVQAAMLAQLRANARLVEKLRGDLGGLVREIRRARGHIDAVASLRTRIQNFSRRLEGLGEAHRRLSEKACHIHAAIRRSQVLLSEHEISQVRKHLGLNPGRALAKKRWARSRGLSVPSVAAPAADPKSIVEKEIASGTDVVGGLAQVGDAGLLAGKQLGGRNGDGKKIEIRSVG